MPDQWHLHVLAAVDAKVYWLEASRCRSVALACAAAVDAKVYWLEASRCPISGTCMCWPRLIVQ
jgi:hypothetical protein